MLLLDLSPQQKSRLVVILVLWVGLFRGLQQQFEERSLDFETESFYRSRDFGSSNFDLDFGNPDFRDPSI